jgi:diadenylate cyclase
MQLLPVLGWKDVLDILLVAVVVYRVLLLFRGTRALQMLAGIAVLLGVSILSRHFELHSVQWLLDNFWSFWAVALVVLFQPELRRALARMGQGRLLRDLFGAHEEERARSLDDLVAAAQTLAARRIGALVVIERTGALRHYAELGVPLDAVLTPDLLQSLFLPPSPLHDGAVLVRGARVVAAGCFLPLSRNAEVARQFGTRHRAALGVSEETDAVAVVVSEETGRISLAVEGRLETTVDRDGLRRRLADLVEGMPAPPSFWRGLRRLLPKADEAT